ncbi:uncharacterized protein LOC123408188 [Hordeum vulgare subsp. vulgare]|uniref:uncharacterized protein LOC123408188 n=1 Tax=Hordeum vulgare subsp. vulgare TaxID=112509 RepID=UPI001D1A3A5D|nr:uncharacterized protein LOC123408188 [Hordeum vulgare subsp. vulgare]
MEHLQDGHHVRLRSRVHGTYLHANEDGHGVSLHHCRASMNAAWAVHLYQGDADDDAQAQHVLLHSAAYGRYLAATNAPAPLGHRGRRVEQRNYDDQEEEAIRWQAVGADSGNDVLLRNVVGRNLRDGARHHLRANGRYIRTGVSVDVFDNFSTKMLWAVEPIPARDGMPPLRRPICLPFPGRLTTLLEPRLIVYVRAGADGTRISHGAFVFRGKSVFHLRKKLARRLEALMDVSNLAMCVEAGTFGRLTPLVVDLPRSRHIVGTVHVQELHIVVFAGGTPVRNWLELLHLHCRCCINLLV